MTRKGAACPDVAGVYLSMPGRTAFRSYAAQAWRVTVGDEWPSNFWMSGIDASVSSIALAIAWRKACSAASIPIDQVA